MSRRLLLAGILLALIAGGVGYGLTHRTHAVLSPPGAGCCPDSPYPTSPGAVAQRVGLNEPAAMDGTTVVVTGVTFDPCIGVRSSSPLDTWRPARPGYTYATVHATVSKSNDAPDREVGFWQLVLVDPADPAVSPRSFSPLDTCAGSNPVLDYLNRGDSRTFAISFEMPGDRAYQLVAVWRPTAGPGDDIEVAIPTVGG